MEDVDIEQILLRSREDLFWYGDHLNELLKDYENRFVAIYEKKIIDTDSNIDKLIIKLKKKGLDPRDLLVRFVSKIKFVL